MIDEKALIELIKDHKEKVRCDNASFNTIYGMAHDHIIELVEILATHSKGGEK